MNDRSPISLEDLIALAREAYQAYGRTTGNRDYQGLPMPEWDGMTPTIRSAWINSVEATIHHLTVVLTSDMGGVFLARLLTKVELKYRPDPET
jgi:hypothetical protein